MIKNILYGSGQSITLAVGQNYTLKDDEVFINGVIVKKCDIEIALQNASSSSTASDVRLAVRKRDGLFNAIPADFSAFDEWQIDGSVPNNLSECASLINNSIECAGGGAGGGDANLANWSPPGPRCGAICSGSDSSR